MKILRLAALSLVMSSGYSLAESTPLNTIREYMAAWNAYDASRAAQFFVDDTVYYDAATGEPVNGRGKAKKEVVSASIKAIPDLSWKMVGKPVYDEDTVTFRWESSGKNSGKQVGSSPTNNLIKFEGVSYTHVKAGKIIWRGDYCDFKKLDEELKPVKQSVAPLYKQEGISLLFVPSQRQCVATRKKVNGSYQT